MKTYSEEEARADLHDVLEQARVRGFVRVRWADGLEFIIHPAAAGGISDRLADEREAWFDAIAPIVAVRDDLRCTGCGYNVRGLPAQHQCPECGQPVGETLEAASAVNLGLRSNLRRAQTEFIAESTDYPPDALLFTIDAVVDHCRRNLRALPRGPVPLDAPRLCTVVRDCARRYFNDDAEARELLGEWNIHRSEDIGAIVSALMHAGALAVTGCDRAEDFSGIFTLATLFDQ